MSFLLSLQHKPNPKNRHSLRVKGERQVARKRHRKKRKIPVGKIKRRICGRRRREIGKFISWRNSLFRLLPILAAIVAVVCLAYSHVSLSELSLAAEI